MGNRRGDLPVAPCGAGGVHVTGVSRSGRGRRPGGRRSQVACRTGSGRPPEGSRLEARTTMRARARWELRSTCWDGPAVSGPVMTTPPPEIPAQPGRRTAALAAQFVALLVAICCASVTAWCLYDAAYLAHASNDWGDPAVIDVFIMWVVSIAGGLLSLGLAIFIRPRRPGLLIPTLVLALAGPLLLFFVPSAMRVNKARHQKEYEEMVRKMEPAR